MSLAWRGTLRHMGSPILPLTRLEKNRGCMVRGFIRLLRWSPVSLFLAKKKARQAIETKFFVQPKGTGPVGNPFGPLPGVTELAMARAFGSVYSTVPERLQTHC